METMTRDQIRARVTANLQGSDGGISLLRVDCDSIGEWRIIAVAKIFENKSLKERRDLALAGLEEIAVEWLELLTPSESEWAGNFPDDSNLEQLPLWPEALARATEDLPHFPSQLDEDLELPITATFYSLRGGVGRSTALAYAAFILSAQGRKVICVDMDLEAPGLPALFGIEDDVKDGSGLVPLLLELDKGENPDLTKHLLRVSESEELYCLPAGRPDASYARMLGSIDPSSWYREEKNPLRELIHRLKFTLPFRPDVILLDSRTGISPISAPLLFDLADISIIAFFPHPQAKMGTGALVRALLSGKTQRVRPDRLTPEPRFIVTPIPSSRIPEVVRRYQHRAIEWIGEWVASSNQDPEKEPIINENEITHFVPYKESIASSDQISRDKELWRDYRSIAEWIERFLPSAEESAAPPTVGSLKSQILAELQFSGGTAEDQIDLLATFVETDLVKRALGSSPLIIGRKGTGKTAIFRRIAEDAKRHAIIITRSNSGGGNLLSLEGFRSIDAFLAQNKIEWSQFWANYIAQVVFSSKQFEGRQSSGPNEELVAPTTEMEMVAAIKAALTKPDSGLITRDWLYSLDEASRGPTPLLFDGLDTGFGSSEQDRKRRKSALEGLFSFYLGISDSLKNLHFKILLREDIWRQLRFENKSHFFGKTETLKWNDQASLFKVAIKQALRSPGFANLIEGTVLFARRGGLDIGIWGEAEVFSAWNILVGERMKGGNTTFTRNWVWNRLADANGDHSPRYLIQLLHQVVQWERRENARSPYDKSILRPRGLIEVLPQVSEQALSAMRDEEFQELAPLMERLIQVARTPLAKDELLTVENLLELAREVGLLGVYEGSEENVDRFKVPELFRYALKMTRKGQA